MNDEFEKSIPSDAYTREYYESHCDGYTEFRDSMGANLPTRLRVPFDLAEITCSMSILDVGCGRGEILVQAGRCGARAFGFDYAVPALQVAKGALARQSGTERINIHCGNAQWLPYPDGSFDRVFMLDVVEHLYPAELHRALVEVRRTLRTSGQLIIHTMPNTWYYHLGYPLFRFAQRCRGKHLPPDPRDRWEYKHVHVNEQNLILLRRELESAGFEAKVWLAPIHEYAEEPNQHFRWMMRALATIYPFRFIFCNDLFAIATRPSAPRV